MDFLRYIGSLSLSLRGGCALVSVYFYYHRLTRGSYIQGFPIFSLVERKLSHTAFLLEIITLILFSAIVYAGLVHVYMSQFPYEILVDCFCDGLAAREDTDKLIAMQQEKAIEALKEFAKATGNTSPENMNSLNFKKLKQNYNDVC
ncbi:hypothetical protein SELMODRAFT_406428 [Selaginella moellendorffii]|uniref:Uncharacterized protein n=1 Tax=Selaginella moellendorffii TaxID=88036 RepID=D8R2C1_SELML|nr:hypothetical protein SELMODRAFT_406428 [Selaginella moellendorffii]